MAPRTWPSGAATLGGVLQALGDLADARRQLERIVLAVAALREEAGPDLPGEVIWWQTGDFWQYAILAAIA